MQAEDRLLQMTEQDLDRSHEAEATSIGSDLTVHHLKPPSSYLIANWPLAHAALSPDGVDLAVAGRCGLALYSRRSARWRLFGDISQEKELSVHVGLPSNPSSPPPPLLIACNQQVLISSSASVKLARSKDIFGSLHLPMGNTSLRLLCRLFVGCQGWYLCAEPLRAALHLPTSSFSPDTTWTCPPA